MYHYLVIPSDSQTCPSIPSNIAKWRNKSGGSWWLKTVTFTLPRYNRYYIKCLPNLKNILLTKIRKSHWVWIIHYIGYTQKAYHSPRAEGGWPKRSKSVSKGITPSKNIVSKIVFSWWTSFNITILLTFWCSRSSRKSILCRKYADFSK